MAATFGFPFTSSQWKELERQALIYKYMMASVPVPSDLLLPISRNLSADSNIASHSPLGSVFNLRYSNNKDPEPGRCKRTDGKKWRCSRDVAPNQKYCERHMHRGRPRSRKPVEAQNASLNNKKTRLQNNPLSTTPAALPTVQTGGSSPQLLGSTVQPNDTHLFLDPKTNRNISDSSYKESNRGLDWVMEGEMASQQQWQHLMQTNLGLTTEASIFNTNPTVFQQDYEVEPLVLNPYTGFGACENIQQNDECNFFLNSERQTPRGGFIDAWSNDNPNSGNSKESSVSSQGNLSPSLSLSMTMESGNPIGEMGQIQMGLDVKDADHHKPHVGNWWLSPMNLSPGGPLAEVLRPGTFAVDSNPTSHYPGYGDSTISPPATTESSPITRTRLSLSDSSVCNSPNVAAPATTPDTVAFQWLS